MRIKITTMLLLVLTLLGACKKKDTENPNVLKKTVKLHGTVVDQDLKPLSGATVSFNGKIFTSNSGFYVFDDVAIAAGRQTVKATMPGYLDAVVGFEATQSTSSQVKIVMVKKVLTGSIDGSTGGSVTNGAAQVTLPANGLKNADGSAFSGTANLYTFHYNPGDSKFSQMTPGGDLSARNTSGDSRQLLSYGMISVHMEDASGNPLQVASGKTATIKLPIDAAQLSSSPDTIKLWHLNETTGIWEEEGKAVKQGSFYVGVVSHFSTWNTDHDEDVAWVKGKVVNCNGTPISTADATVADATPGSGNRPQNNISLENQGLFIMRVASGFPLTVTVYPYGDRGNPVTASVPPLAPGQTYDIGTVIGPCGTTATGRLVDGNGNPVRGMVHIESGVMQNNVDVWDGQISIDLALNKTYTITPYCMDGAMFGDPKTITTSGTPGSLTLGDLHTCPSNGNNGQTDVTQSFFTANGGPFSNESFHFNTSGGSTVAVFAPADSAYTVTVNGTHSGSSESMMMTVMVYGLGPGTYTIDDSGNQGTATVTMQLYTGTSSQKVFVGKSGTLTLTSASTVGQPVAATFNGTFDYSDTGSSTVSVTVTNGSIKGIRLQ
ncbi:MAG: carboxypeptidase-like regulatory domain-containing protein [Chitinophagales bacterium]